MSAENRAKAQSTNASFTRALRRYFRRVPEHDSYAEIGIDLRFHAAKDFGRPSESLRGKRTIMLAFSERTPPDFHPDAVAFVRPWTVLSRCSAGTRRATAALFGHVLAHEVGHMLQGINRHSEEGVMKAAWSGREISSMSWDHLQFTLIDAKLIHDGLSDGPGSSETSRAASRLASR